MAGKAEINHIMAANANARYSAHHCGLQFKEMGIEVRLISPQYVAPFVKTDKNDANDATAIIEAASRPQIRFITVKSVEQQNIRAIHRARALLVHQRTALINQVRGLLAERGVIMAQTPTAFKRALPSIQAKCDGELTRICQTLITDLLEQLRMLEKHIARTNQWITFFLKSSELCKKIEAIDGVGPIIATAMVAAVGDAKAFKNGRHLS